MFMGIWKNYEELEESLTLDELEALIEAGREREYRAMKFAAALKGIDLDENNDEERLTTQDVMNRALAKERGMTAEQAEYEEFGISVEKYE